MCGFAGFFDKSKKKDTSFLNKMLQSISHRGPDDQGLWLDDNYEIGLAHRRLSIIDLSKAGHQPMISKSKRFVIAFNGEIYNHLELRKSLENSNKLINNWIGTSDTETLLACIDVWGLEATLKSCVGMFSFALWDKKKRSLFLARDRIGEKPLYYGWQHDVFLFGSELKALKCHPSFKSNIDRNSLSLFIRHNYIPTPNTIYKNIYKLEPGFILELSSHSLNTKLWPYWSSENIVCQDMEEPYQLNPDQAINKLEGLINSSILSQMEADVPLGAFLSGGVDSSTIVALMQNQSTKPIKTFTIGFDEADYNEALNAKAVANHIGTEHTELYVKSNDVMNVIPKLPSIYCEPFSDSSQIPTFLVSKLAKQHVKVSLSGDGGDELFCGYNRYKITSSIWEKIKVFPPFFRNILAKAITSISAPTWNKIAKYTPYSKVYNNIGDKLHKGATVLDSNSIDQLYLGLVSHTRNPSEYVIGSYEPKTKLNNVPSNFKSLDNVEKMMALDLITYLPDDILVKIDRAAMSNSLETRVPFLDHRVVEFAWKLPISLKIRDKQTKWILRQILYKYVPRKLIERPKMGFGVPIGNWLRGPLKDWAENLINKNRLICEGYFNPELIYKIWQEHQSNQRNWEYLLWNILMFQAWLDENKKLI